MDLWWHVDGASAVVQRRRALVVGGLILTLLLSCMTDSHAQQSERPKAAGSSIPTIEALPHSPMPAGDFVEWCGERVVYQVGRGYEIRDGGMKASPLTFPYKSSLHCGYDAQNLVFVDEEAGLVSEVDVGGGAVTRTLATYDKGLDKGVMFQRLSFSPDLKSVVSSQPLTLVAPGVNFKIIHLKELGDVRWNRDSSRFFGLRRPKGSSSFDVVEIFNGQGRRISSGPLPAGFFSRDGWFANSKALYLRLHLSRDEFGSGVVFRCPIEGWKCVPIARNVLGASVGGGALAMVRAIGKHSSDGDTTTYPPGYLVEIRNEASQVVARQTFRSSERFAFHLDLSQSGLRAILRWAEDPKCPVAEQDSDKCRVGIRRGIMIDLSGVIK